MHITAAIVGMVITGVVGFIFGWLQGHVEAAREQTSRMIAQKQFNESRSKLVQSAGPYCMGMDCVCNGDCPALRTQSKE